MITGNFDDEILSMDWHEAELDSRQIYFVNQIVEVFTDLTVWQGSRAVIEGINSNAVA